MCLHMPLPHPAVDYHVNHYNEHFDAVMTVIDSNQVTQTLYQNACLGTHHLLVDIFSSKGSRLL